MSSGSAGRGSLEITTQLVARGPGSAFVLTEEQVAAVGEGAKRFPAAATINGHRLRTTVVPMRGEFLFGLSKASREEASVQIGDRVTFTLELDEAPREVEVPPALAAALDADREARRAFDALAYTHRKEAHAGSRRPSATRLASGGSRRRSR